MDCDVGMFRWAGRGGRKAEAVGKGSGTSPFSGRPRGAGAGRTRTRGLVRPRWDRRPESGRVGSPPAEDRERVRWGEVCGDGLTGEGNPAFV